VHSGLIGREITLITDYRRCASHVQCMQELKLCVKAIIFLLSLFAKQMTNKPNKKTEPTSDNKHIIRHSLFPATTLRLSDQHNVLYVTFTSYIPCTRLAFSICSGYRLNFGMVVIYFYCTPTFFFSCSLSIKASIN